MDKKHIEVVSAIIEENGLYFVTKRKGTGESAYKWEFPGGKIEAGETKEEALVREIKEELACDIEVKEELFVTNYEYQSFTMTMYSYKAIRKSGFKLLEHLDYKWLPLDELDSLDFSLADRIVIQELIKNKIQ